MSPTTTDLVNYRYKSSCCNIDISIKHHPGIGIGYWLNVNIFNTFLALSSTFFQHFFNVVSILDPLSTLCRRFLDTSLMILSQHFTIIFSTILKHSLDSFSTLIQGFLNFYSTLSQLSWYSLCIISILIPHSICLNLIPYTYHINFSHNVFFCSQKSKSNSTSLSNLVLYRLKKLSFNSCFKSFPKFKERIQEQLYSITSDYPPLDYIPTRVSNT